MTSKPDWGAFVQNLRTKIAERRRLHLEPLELGRLQIHQSGVGITKSEIASLRRNIARIEAVIAQHADAV
jgi:ribosomal protein L29